MSAKLASTLSGWLWAGTFVAGVGSAYDRRLSRQTKRVLDASVVGMGIAALLLGTARSA